MSILPGALVPEAAGSMCTRSSFYFLFWNLSLLPGFSAVIYYTKKVEESPSLEAFKKCVVEAHSDMV